MDSWLKKKKDSPKKSWIEDNTNEESTSEQQENGRADCSWHLYYASHRRWNKNDLMKVDQKSTEKFEITKMIWDMDLIHYSNLALSIYYGLRY